MDKLHEEFRKSLSQVYIPLLIMVIEAFPDQKNSPIVTNNDDN